MKKGVALMRWLQLVSFGCSLSAGNIGGGFMVYRKANRKLVLWIIRKKAH
jgi:hypothetical protein